MLLDATETHRDEVDRSKALLQYAVLDSLPDLALDEITKLAAELCNAQYAFIGFLDAHRIWLKSRVGFSARELLRGSSATAFSILNSNTADGAAQVSADPEDGRTSETSISLEPGISCRSFVSAPLLTPSGIAIGTLTVLSAESNAFSHKVGARLEILARQVMTRLELYSREGMQERVIRARQRIERALLVERNFVSAVLETMNAPVLVLDTAGRIVRFNHACERISGYKIGELAGRSFPEQLFLPDERERAMEIFERAAGRNPVQQL